jgi:RNA polymerase sigma-70 factor (ECF subfamily)
MADPDTDLSSEALRTLVENKQRFLGFLERRLGNPELAAEILQEAFLKGVEKGSTLRDEESALAWCYRLLRNAVIDRQRRLSAEKGALARLAQELGSMNPGAEELEQQVCTCMAHLIGTLKPEYSEILRRVDLEDTKLETVSAELQITPNNAAVRLHRARQALRQRLEQMCGVCAHHGCLNCTCEHK